MTRRREDSLRGSIAEVLKRVRRMSGDDHDLASRARLKLFCDTWLIPLLERALAKATKKKRGAK